MADNELALFQWQLATQSALDTAVTPTAKLMGAQDGELAPMVESSVVEESRASLAPAYNVTVDKITGEGTIPQDANYEQIGYFLDSLLGQATPTGADPYVRAYAAPLATVPTPRILTAVRGSALDTRGLIGGIVNELSLKAESNKRVTTEAKLIGHSVAADALASLSDTVVNFIHANQCAIKLDTWAGTMGATALTPTVYNIELGLNMNKMMQMGIGAVSPLGHKIRKTDPGSNQLKVSMELDAASAAYYTSVISPSGLTPFKAQIQFAFTLDADHSLTIQYAGFTPEAPKYVSDVDGVATLDFVFSPLYHSTFANWLKISLTNKVASLP